MVDGRRVAIVMPMFNEAGHVGRTLQAIPAWVDNIVVVDDGSSDDSRRVVEESEDARVRLVGHPVRSGVGRALQTGFRVVLEHDPAFVITMDSDGQMSADDLPRLLDPIFSGAADYAKGSRLSKGISLSDMPWHRRVVNRFVSAYFARVLKDPRLRDIQCGFTAMTREVVVGLSRLDLHGSYGVYNDVLAHVLLKRRGRVAYVPVQAIYAGEKSHVRLRDIVALAPLFARLTLRALGAPPRSVTSEASPAVGEAVESKGAA